MFFTYYVIHLVFLSYLISFLALFAFSLDYYAHFSLYYLTFLLRAFDHICMEKARYKFLIIIIIIIILYAWLLAFTKS